jgi:hypothetical protein
MAACGEVKLGPVYAGGVELAEPAEPVVPGERVAGGGVGGAVGGAGLAAVAGSRGLAAVAAAGEWCGWAPAAFAWCGDPDAQADTKIIKPAAPASGMRWGSADRCACRRRGVSLAAAWRAELAKRCMASPFC